MNTLEKAELTALIRHIVTFLKSGIPIYNSEISDTADRKGKKKQEMKKKNTGNCKVLCVSHRRKNLFHG